MSSVIPIHELLKDLSKNVKSNGTIIIWQKASESRPVWKINLLKTKDRFFGRLKYCDLDE
jgi:hypothetical protein